MNLSYDPPEAFRDAVDQVHEIVAKEVGSDGLFSNASWNTGKSKFVGPYFALNSS